MATAYEKLMRLKLPKRAGRCWCGQHYYAGSTEVVFFRGKFQHVQCLPDDYDGNQAKQRRLQLLNQIAIENGDIPM